MATNAARDRATHVPRERAKRPPKTPQRWWQWVLIYPALVIAMLTAAPQWVEMYRKSTENIKVASVADAEKQAQLWRKNLSCSAAPFSWYNNPSNIKIDATICDSGDIFVRAATPGNGQFFKWLPLEDVVQTNSASGNGVIPPANAATRSDRLEAVAARAPVAQSLFHLAQMATVLCQKIVDGRYIHRRVQTPDGCFDEVIDTYNGQVVRRNSAPCTPQC